MNRAQYRVARRLIRSNGRAALRWLDRRHAETMQALAAAPSDYIAARAAFIAGCAPLNRCESLRLVMRCAWLTGETFV